MYRPGASQDTFVLDDYEINVSPFGSSSLTPVTFDVANLVEDDFGDSNALFSFNANDPMNGQTSQAGGDASKGVVFDFAGGERFYAIEVHPSARDFRERPQTLTASRDDVRESSESERGFSRPCRRDRGSSTGSR